jgi:hypothetical protein
MKPLAKGGMCLSVLQLPQSPTLYLIVAVYWHMLVSATVSQAICQLQLVCVSVVLLWHMLCGDVAM